MSELVPAAVLPTVSEVVQVEPGQIVDSKSWVPIQKSMPPEGGIVDLAPGEYPIIKSWSRPGLLVVRAADPNDRPRVREGAGAGGHQTAWSGLLLEDIDFLPGSGEVTSLPDCDFIGLKGVTIDGKKNNGVHLSNSDRTHFEATDTLITRSGQGNTKHNVYIGRIPSARFERVYSHSSKGSHALKSIARNTQLRYSWLGTVGPEEIADPASPYRSTTLLDIVSCGRSLVVGTRLEHWQADDTGNQIIAYRTRNSILSCDEPPYGDVILWDAQAQGPAPAGYEGPLEPVGDNDNLRNRYWAKIERAMPFWDPAFWAGSPPWFTHSLQDVEIIERGQGNRAIGIDMEGTAPEIVSRTFGPALQLPKPPDWYERAVLIRQNVAFAGDFKTEVRGV